MADTTEFLLQTIDGGTNLQLPELAGVEAVCQYPPFYLSFG